MRTNLSTTADRSACKPSNSRLADIRNSMGDLPCMTCDYEVDWSRLTGQHGHAGAAWLGHVLAPHLFVTGGGYVGGNIGPHCRTCQYATKNRYADLSAFVIRENIPARFLSSKISKNGPDIRDRAPVINPTPALPRLLAIRARGIIVTDEMLGKASLAA